MVMQRDNILNLQTAKIILLTDGRPGHMTQSEGVARLLQHTQNLQIEWLQIRHLQKWQKKISRFCVNYLDLSRYLASVIHLPTAMDWQNVAYIVSAGADTLLANVLLTRYLRQQHIQVQNIALSSLHGIHAKHFDVVFTIDAAKAHVPHYLYYPLSPNKMTARDFDIAQLKQTWQVDRIITVCIGANIDGLNIGSAKVWGEYIQALKQNFPQHQLYISTSRRTPQHFEQQLKMILHEVLHEQDQLFLYSEQQVNVAELFAMADFVVLSQDSGSMISEAVMAAQKTLVIQPIGKYQHVVMQKFLQQLQQQQAIALWHHPQQNLHAMLQSVRIQKHSANLHQALSKHLGLLEKVSHVA
jgi:mitochondrial fission protein ELM1